MSRNGSRSLLLTKFCVALSWVAVAWGARVMEKARTVYLIRHAESRYNAGVKSYSLRALLRETDHGLSPRGVEQCRELRQTLEARLAAKDKDAAAIAAAEALASPLRRALQTAHLALGATQLVALPEGREHCAMPVFARDSVGTPRSTIESALRRELGGSPDLIVDVGRIQEEEWWTVGEVSEAIEARLRGLLVALHDRAQARPAVFVGHSRAIREIFRLFGAPHPDFQRRIVENCAVLKLYVALEAADAPVVLDASFVFDSNFRDRYIGEP